MMNASELLKSIGWRVRTRRRRRGWARPELARRAQLSLRFLAQLESGEGNISISRLSQVAAALDCSLRSLMPATPSVFSPDLDPNPQQKKIIALIGLRGAGKSSAGSRLAKRLHLPFMELDALIEHAASMPLAQIFSMHGESYYRRLEHRVLNDVLKRSKSMVLATGGSIVTDPHTWNLVKQHATTVWLKATPKTYWNRLLKQGDTRPMKDNPAAMTELRQLLARREPLYAEADFTIDTSKRTLAQTTEAILKRLGKN
ncbi:MAG: shikimate kinase [Acidobacteriia bacterium]|nr:shikimate kinase [Terriglobia bacterium]